MLCLIGLVHCRVSDIWVCYHFFLISFPLSSLCGALVVLVLVFLSGLTCTAYMVVLRALRVLYVVVLCLFHFCLSFVSWFPLLNPFLATMLSFAGYFHARFLLSAFFPVCLFFCFSPTAFVPSLFWCNLACDHSWIRSGPVNNVR